MTESTAQRITITLMTDWGAGPFWVSVNGDISDPHNADEVTDVVPLSPELRADVAEWDQRYQRTYNAEAPQDSGIRDADARAAHIADGLRLAQRIRTEAPSMMTVEYVDIDGKEWPIAGGGVA